MRLSEKTLLARIFSASLGAQHPALASEDSERLSKAGLLKNGKITDLGRARIRVILAGGVFDIIHPGHIHTLNEAKGLGDVLVVVVATDTMAEKAKKRRPLHTKEQRRNLVLISLNMVDVCMVGSAQFLQHLLELSLRQNLFKCAHPLMF